MEASNLPSPNERLRRERIGRNWRQQDLADQVGTTVVTINRWERGGQQPGAYFRIKLCALFGKSAEELGLGVVNVLPASPPERDVLEETSRGSSPIDKPALWTVPYRRNPYFTGRTDLLQQIHTLLQQIGSVALSGLGGIGKTQAALEYAYRYAHDYTAIVWVTAETHETIIASYRAFATTLSLLEKEDQDQRKMMSAIIQWFNTHRRWLLILDNVEDLTVLKPFLSTAREGTFFITTRLHSVGILAQNLEMQQMTREEGIHFLLHRTHLVPSHEAFETVSQSNYRAASQIAHALDGLPLALDQAGAYIHEYGCNLTDFLHLFQMSPGRLLDAREENAHHPLSVAKTFTLIYEELEQKNPALVELLLMCSFLAPDAIPERLFTESAPLLGSAIQALVSNPWQWNAALKDLLRYSLIMCHPESKTFSIHRLVQAVIRDRISEQDQCEYISRLVTALVRIFPRESLKMEHWSWCEQLVPHIIKVVSTREQITDPIVVSSLLYQTATYLCHRASHLEAERYYQQALNLREQILGIEHPLLADPLIGLVEASYFLNNYPAVIAYAQRVIGILEQTQGAEAFALIRPLNVLANIYRVQMQFAEAERSLLRSLSIWITTVLQETFGAEHPASGVSELMGGEQGAEVLIQQALSLWEQTSDRHHYSIGQALSNLSIVYQQQQRYAEAEAILLPLYQLGKQALGERHYMIAFSLMILAEVYKGQGKLIEAEQCYREALTLREEALGPQHPQTVETRISYEALLRISGRCL